MRGGPGVGILIGVLSAACAAASPVGTVPVESVPVTTASLAVTPSPTRPTSTTLPAATAPSTIPPTTAPTTATTAAAALIDRSNEATGSRIVADVAALVGFGPRVAGSAAERAAGDWITERLRELVGSVETMRIELPSGRSSRNLWVTFGNPNAGPWTLLGAHYDSIADSPGADDNASGTAILLELARRLTEEPPSAGVVTIMLFGAEEVFAGLSRDDHHYGSRQWVAARVDGGRALPDLMVSVDMVGIGAELYGVAYRGTSTRAVDELVAAADGIGLVVRRLDRGDISDHEPFARAGVPAAMLWRPSNPAYHTPDDDSVDAERVIDVVAILQALVQRRHPTG
jgi:acetylornithine deacetylase/succinyl-diaminopimelate desuccinylase-like protein